MSKIWHLVVVLLLAAQVGADELSRKDLAAGRKLYVAKCAKCHRFYDPKAYSAPEWRQWMDSMSRSAKLKPEQQRLLSAYLDAYRAGQLPGRPQDKLPSK